MKKKKRFEKSQTQETGETQPMDRNIFKKNAAPKLEELTWKDVYCMQVSEKLIYEKYAPFSKL